MIDITKGRYWDEGIELISGCTPCSPGCDHCWSAAQAQRFGGSKLIDEEGCPHIVENGKFTGEITTYPDRLKRFNTRKPKVFSLWNDLFHEAVSGDFIGEVFSEIDIFPQNTYLILTKRVKRASWIMDWIGTSDDAPVLQGFPFNNVYFGLTVCNQQEADEKIPIFLRIPGKKYLSLEPLLAPVSLWHFCDFGKCFDAVILGGETGHGARPMNPDWAISVVRQCKAAGVPIFVKQIHINGKPSKDMSEWPEELRVRELPWH